MGITHFKELSSLSGFYIGDKSSEKSVFPNPIGKIDIGMSGVSGVLLSVSTRLSTVTQVVANLVAAVSGRVSVAVDCSGHCIDLRTYNDLGAATDLSGSVKWIAVGV